MMSLLRMCRDLGRRALKRLRLWRRTKQPRSVRPAGGFEASVMERACSVGTLEEAQQALPPEWAPMARNVVRDPLQVIRRLAPLLADGVGGATVVTGGAKGSRQLHFVRFGARWQR